MNQQVSCVDKETLVAFIYGECEDDERQRVDAHVATCRACAGEVAALGGVREALAQWVPPAAAGGFRIVRDEESAPAAVLTSARWWRRPVEGLARVAAAVLLFAGGAALANLDVQYGADGFVVRTGWRRQAAVAQPPGSASVVPASGRQAPGAVAAPWRSDIIALERQIRGDFSSQLAAARAAASPAAAATPLDRHQLMSQVRTLIEDSISDSERRQQREFAYRLTQLQGEVGAQRQADLIRLQQGLWGMQGQTGAEVAQQRQLINYLINASRQK